MNFFVLVLCQIYVLICPIRSILVLVILTVHINFNIAFYKIRTLTFHKSSEIEIPSALFLSFWIPIRTVDIKIDKEPR